MSTDDALEPSRWDREEDERAERWLDELMEVTGGYVRATEALALALDRFNLDRINRARAALGIQTARPKGTYETYWAGLYAPYYQ